MAGRAFVPCADAAGVYERSAPEAGEDYGWVGYVPWPDSAPGPGASIDTDQALLAYSGTYLFARDRPASIGSLAADVAAFLKRCPWPPQALIWMVEGALPDPGDTQWVIQFSQQPFSVTSTSNFAVCLGPDEGFGFEVSSATAIGWDPDRQAITIGNAAGFFYSGPPPSDGGLSVIAQGLVGAVIPIFGPRAGSFTLTARMTPASTFALPGLTAGVRYWASSRLGDVPCDFPLIDPSGAGMDAPLDFATAIDPVDPFNLALPATGTMSLAAGQVRTGMTLVGGNAVWSSFLRSVEGRTILLAPLPGEGADAFAGPSAFAGGFTFTAAGGSLHPHGLTPCGDFGLAVEPTPPGAAGQTLLAGLFGSERFTFTNWNGADPQAGSRLRFRAGRPAYAPVFPFPQASMTDVAAGNPSARLTGTYRTAWVNVLGPGSSPPLYRAEPDGGAYFGGTPASADAPLLVPTPPGTAVPQDADFFVPVAPYAGFTADPGWSAIPNAVGEFESQILSATRKSALGGRGSCIRLERKRRRLERTEAESLDTAGAWTTTRQGLLAEVSSAPGATDFLEIVLAQYQPRPPPPPAPVPPLALFGFTDPTETLQEAMQTNQLFVAAVNAGPLAGFSKRLDISDWQFTLDVGSGVQPTDYSNVLILKYCDGALIDWVQNPGKWTDPHDFSLIPGTDPGLGLTGLSTWLAAYLQDAIDRGRGTGAYAGKANPLYANIADIATRGDWKGFLALKASLPSASSLPEQIEGLAAGIAPAKFYAHHFGATQSRVKPNPDPGAARTLAIDGVSALFGLVDYQDPLYVANIASGGDPDSPLMADSSDPLAFRVLLLQALFVNARMTDFKSRIQLTINRFFGAPVATTQFEGAVRSANGIVLDGSAVTQNGTTVYVFDQGNPTLFTFAAPALNGITVSRIQFNTLGVAPYAWPSGSVPTVTSRFLLWGAFDFATVLDSASPPGPCDILSFGSPAGGASQGVGLAYSNLQVTMRSPQANPGITDFDFDPSSLAFDLGGSTLRPDSLFAAFALQLQSFIYAPADKTPLDYGFLTVAPDRANVAALSGGWCGIVHKINMGGPGALVAAAGFSSQLLVAWSPVAGSAPAVFVGVRLPGTAPGASAFSLQGVFKITTGAITLEQPATGGFNLKLANIGATFLGIKKIPDATIQFYLFGDPQGTGSLGWYASYNASNAGGTGTSAPALLPQAAPLADGDAP